MFYVFERTSGQQSGPFNPGELEQKWQMGEYGEDALVWWEGLQDWVPMAQVFSGQQVAGETIAQVQAAQDQSMPPIRQQGRKEAPNLKQRWVMAGIFLCGSLLLIYLYATL